MSPSNRDETRTLATLSAGNVFEHLMPEGVRQTIGIGHRHVGVDPDADIDEQAMSEPARLDVKNLADAY